MRIPLKLSLCISIVLFFNVLFMIPYSYAGELDIKMGKMVKRMTKTINEKYPEMDNAAMAIFPFNADEKLNKRKVDFAVTEILTQQFLKNSKLRLVERTQLEKILNEQKLGLSGAVDSETAAKVGKLLGARLSLIGVVSRMGKSYQVSAKIADNDTAEILAVDIDEISAEVFDEEAGRYLTLVPETQVIGLYISFSASSLQVINASPKQFAGVTITPLNPAQELHGFSSLGVKYYFYGNRLLADLTFTPMAVQYSDYSANRGYFSLTDTDNGISLGGSGTKALSGTESKATIMYRLKIHDRWSGFLGGGFAEAKFGTKTEMEAVSINGLKIERVEMKEKKYATPIIRAGVEYRPQSRFGIGFFGNYYIQKVENAILQDIYEYSADRTHKMEIFKFSMPQTYFEITTSLYF